MSVIISVRYGRKHPDKKFVGSTWQKLCGVEKY
jgi:hypothetical protein